MTSMMHKFPDQGEFGRGSNWPSWTISSARRRRRRRCRRITSGCRFRSISLDGRDTCSRSISPPARVRWPSTSRCTRSARRSKAKPMSFKQNDMRKADFLTINPAGKVPTLLIDGRVLTEVAASCSIWRGAFRTPTCCRGRYRGRGAGRVLDVVHRLDTASGPQAGARPCPGGLQDRRPALGSGWILGERYSIADIHLFRLYWRLFNSLKPASDEFPNLDAHYARMMARPAVKKTIEVETAVGYELPA